MSEHAQTFTEVHALAVAPRRGSKQDAAGGTNEPTDLVGTDQKSIMGASAKELDMSSTSASDIEEPTDEELHTLRRVGDKIPWSAFLVAVVELAERFAYYGLSGPFQNYISQPYTGGTAGVAGGLGMGEQAATGLGDMFQFLCYITPILGAIVADQFLGRYNTIVVFSIIYMIGILILFLTALPTSLEHGHGLGGLIASMIIIGVGCGGIKANVSPLIAEQYRETKMRIKVLKSGERVVIDPAITIQTIYMIFYACINVGSLSLIATSEMEKHIGFWSAYLLPFCMFIVAVITIVAGRKLYVRRPPTGSILPQAFKAMAIGAKNKFNMDAAKPSWQAEHGNTTSLPQWSDQFIDELKRGITACKVFLFYPIYWVVYTQLTTNLVSQAAEMNLHGIPNDLMQNIDPITIIIFIPICDRIIYPGLRRMGIKFKPITRIFMGFVFGAASMAYAAGVQKLIYEAGPCYEAPGACDAGLIPGSMDEYYPNNVHVAVQTPAYLFIGLSEIFASITGLEYAYTKAPSTMKSFVMSLFLVTNAFGAALAIALIPTAVDPKLLWMYTGLAISCFIAGLIFWALFSRLNETEELMNKLDVTQELEATKEGEHSRRNDSRAEV